MTDELTTPREECTPEPPSKPRPDLVAVPDDPDAATEVTLRPECVSADRLRTAWITVAAEDLLDVTEHR